MKELEGPSSFRVNVAEDPHIFPITLVGPMESGLQCPDSLFGFLLREWRPLSCVGSQGRAAPPCEPEDHLAAGRLGREAPPSSFSPGPDDTSMGKGRQEAGRRRQQKAWISMDYAGSGAGRPWRPGKHGQAGDDVKKQEESGRA